MAAQKRATPKKKTTTTRKKKKQGGYGWKIAGAFLLLILLSPFYYGYVLKTFSATWQWIRDIGLDDTKYRTYTDYHIKIPSQYTIHGIDVSYAQGKINWRKVRAMEEDSVRVTFAFIKTSEGILKVDPYFKRNWREAAKAGIICGPYHFLRSNKNGTWQAKFFLQNVTIEPGDLPPVADIETLDGASPEDMRKELKAFLNYIELHTRVKPIIYTHLSFYADYLAGYFDHYPVWIAHYNHADLNAGKEFKWDFWQHSDRANVNGIYHTVDFDAFSGDTAAFRKMLVQ